MKLGLAGWTNRARWLLIGTGRPPRIVKEAARRSISTAGLRRYTVMFIALPAIARWEA
jgi:hypothetical protein